MQNEINAAAIMAAMTAASHRAAMAASRASNDACASRAFILRATWDERCDAIMASQHDEENEEYILDLADEADAIAARIARHEGRRARSRARRMRNGR